MNKELLDITGVDIKMPEEVKQNIKESYNYIPPITMSVSDEIATEIKKQEDSAILNAVVKCGVDVDKEELIKALNYDRGQYDKGFEDGYYGDKWISIDDSLPIATGDVIVTIEYANIRSAVVCLYDTEKGFLLNRSNDDNAQVIAWQPLPKPYQKESK